MPTMCVLQKRGCLMGSFYPSKNSMRQGNCFRISVLCIRCASLRSDRKRQMRMSSSPRSTERMRRSVHSRNTTSISFHSVILNCLLLLMLFLLIYNGVQCSEVYMLFESHH